MIRVVTSVEPVAAAISVALRLVSVEPVTAAEPVVDLEASEAELGVVAATESLALVLPLTEPVAVASDDFDVSEAVLLRCESDAMVELAPVEPVAALVPLVEPVLAPSVSLEPVVPAVLPLRSVWLLLLAATEPDVLAVLLWSVEALLEGVEDELLVLFGVLLA